jgi:membrane-associated PAP2 superfamily phosphatase
MPLSRELTRDLAAFAGLVALALAWDATGLDLTLAHWYGAANGFALKNNSTLQFWFHDVAQNAARTLFLLCVAMVFIPLGFFKRLRKADRAHLVSASLLAALTVVALKQISLSSCPWSLMEFGGVGRYVSHWQLGVADGGGGRCFPGGHSSSGFAFIAAAFWLRAVSNRWSLLLVLSTSAAGLVLGWVQQMRGAHFLSHTLWAWVVCAAVGLAYYYGVQIIRERRILRDQ